MSLAIVIPAWNAESYISDTIASVINQTETNWKLVIVDDGSSDRTREIALEFEARDSRIMVFSQPNSGLSAARNTGFTAVREDSGAVLFLDADDILEPMALGDLWTALQLAGDDVVGVYGLPRNITATGNLVDIPIEKAWGYDREAIVGLKTRKLAIHEPSSFPTFVIWCTIQTPGQALIKVSSLDRVGPWRTMPGEDWEMWLRLTRTGSFIMLPQFTLQKRMSPNSLSSNGKWLAQAGPKIHETITSSIFTREQRTIAKFGELRAVWLRYSWAIDALNRREPSAFAREFYRATRALAQFAFRLFKY
jgi:glycosyltransferase involved in cell wall biosynthesis